MATILRPQQLPARKPKTTPDAKFMWCRQYPDGCVSADGFRSADGGPFDDRRGEPSYGGAGEPRRHRFIPIEAAERFMVIRTCWMPHCSFDVPDEQFKTELRKVVQPTGLLEIPPFAGEHLAWEMGGEPKLRTREAAFALAATWNAEALEAEPWYVGSDWYVVLELGRYKSTPLVTLRMDEGGVGHMAVDTRVPFRLVHPTPEEIERFS